jgi:hypothetical protein
MIMQPNNQSLINTAFMIAEKQRQYQEQQKQNFMNNEAFGMRTNFAFEQVKQ